MNVVRRLGVSLLLLLAAIPGLAQQSGALEEIIVTATKRAESAQDVPVSITPLSAKALKDAAVVDVTDMGFLAPNVQLQPVSTFPGFATFSMRGLGTGANSIRTLDPTVNVLIDGMVVATQIAGQLDLFDYETVEVARGPQGVFFGRNSIGGVVHMRTGKPTEEFSGRTEFFVGSQGLYGAEAVIQGAISDTVRAKLAIQYRHFDGFFEDNNGGTFVAAPFNPSGSEPGTPQQDQMGQDSIFIKPTITFEPSENFDLTLYGQFYSDNGGSGATQAFIDPRLPTPALVSLFGYTPPDDQFKVNHDLVGKSDTEIFQLVAEANWNVGNGVLTSVTGFRDLEFESSNDIDGTPFLLIHFPNNEEEADQFTQELRFVTDINDNVDLLIGGFYMNAEMSVIERREFSGLTAGRAHELYNYIQSDWTQETESLALFANLRFQLSDKWSGSAGLRYSDEDKELDVVLLGQCSGPGFTGCPNNRNVVSDSWDNLSPRVGVEFRPDDNLMYFATWTRGFRSGNFNARAPSVPALGPADPEQADQFEFGMKGDFLNNTLRTNIAVFYTVYDEIQRVTNGTDDLGNPLQLLRNAAEASIPGVEVELQWSPNSAFGLQASLGWIKPEFDKFTGLELDGQPGITAADEALAEDLEFERIPEFEATIAADYTWNLPQLEGDLTLRVQYAYRDGFPTDVTNNPTRFIEDYDLIDASLRFENERWRIALWGRNLAEENYADIISAAFNQQRFGGQARTYGLELGYRF